jgi:hypothetical protein
VRETANLGDPFCSWEKNAVGTPVERLVVGGNRGTVRTAAVDVVGNVGMITCVGATYLETTDRFPASPFRDSYCLRLSLSSVFVKFIWGWTNELEGGI